jgi:hypothetical protein
MVTLEDFIVAAMHTAAPGETTDATIERAKENARATCRALGGHAWQFFRPCPHCGASGSKHPASSETRCLRCDTAAGYYAQNH